VSNERLHVTAILIINDETQKMLAASICYHTPFGIYSLEATFDFLFRNKIKNPNHTPYVVGETTLANHLVARVLLYGII